MDCMAAAIVQPVAMPQSPYFAVSGIASNTIAVAKHI